MGTAAHCTAGSAASSIRVILGEHNIADSDFNRVDVAEIINHPNYNSQTTDNDYAILRLANPVTFTNEVSPACLPASLPTWSVPLTQERTPAREILAVPSLPPRTAVRL